VPHRCPTKTALLKNYQGLVHQFRESIGAVDDGRPSAGPEKSEQLRKACEAARRELETHRANHGC
jgi:hypothetical protein